MKSHLENIGETVSGSSSLHENGPFGTALEDPFDKTLKKFGEEKKDLNLPRQDKKNFEKECALELVRKKINEIEVDPENPVVAVSDIIEYLKERDIEISEDIKKYTEFAISEKNNFLQDLKRLKIDRDNPNKEEKELLKEMALKDTEWMGDAIEYIRKNKDNPEEIEKFWKEYDKTFLSFKEHENNKDFTKRYSIEQGPEVVKRGILAEIAAMDLLKELVNGFKGCKKVEIEYSTPEEDVYDKIDFFLIVTLENGRIKRIPVQVKSCNISGFTNNYSNIKELERKTRFVLDNVINTDETKNIRIDKKYKYQVRAGKRMNEFFGIEKNKNGIKINKGGFFVILPNGKMNPKFLNPQDESGKTTENCIDKKGIPSEALRSHFLFESQTMKNVEAILKI